MIEQAYALAVLFGGMTLLMTLVVRGKSIFVVAPLCALLTVTLSGRDPVAAMTGPYMSGFADYLRNFYLVFALGAAFGKIFEESGAAAVIAERVGGWLGRERACLAVVLACAILTYGGVSLFVVGFSVYPLAVKLFRAANLPRRFIPAAIAFGSITFTMTSAGSPEPQNLLPTKLLLDAATNEKLTDALAGWPVSLIVGVLMFVVGQWYLERAIRAAVAAGEQWNDLPRDAAGSAAKTDEGTASSAASRSASSESGSATGKGIASARTSEIKIKNKITSKSESENENQNESADLLRPAFGAAMVPLIVTLLALNLLPAVCHAAARHWTLDANASPIVSMSHALLKRFPEDPTLSIFLGVVAALVMLRRQISGPWTCLGDGFINGLLAIGSTASVVGFGAAVKDLPAFQAIVAWVTKIPGDPLIGAAIAVAVISAIAGSASGGQGIALPIIKPIYVDQLGVSPRALHRVVAISSGTLDSLPANGYLVMLIRNICGESHQRAYPPIFVTTVLLPMAGTALAILLYKLVPAWMNY